MLNIPAANDVTIQTDTNQWRLINGHNTDDVPLVNASLEGLSYGPAFAEARNLSPDGKLSADKVLMVVLGWAIEDSSWHLGVLLSPDLAEQRGGRWCGLARWEGLDSTEAERAGKSLAETLEKTFRFVPPPEPETVNQDNIDQDEATPAKPEIPLLPLPIPVGQWRMQENPVGLEWIKLKSWRSETLLRGAFFVIVAPIFAILSLGALTSIFAPVQPQWLPLVGLALSALMLLLGLNQFRRVLQTPTTLIDRRLKIVKQTARWSQTLQSPFEGLAYILVSFVVNQKQSKPGDPYSQFAGEIWLHIYSPRRGFITIVNVDNLEGRILNEADELLKTRRLLDLHESDTPAHHAAVIMGQEIGIPVYVERRS